MGIGFGQSSGDTERRRRKDHRPCDKAAPSEHDVGTARPEDPAARARCGTGQQERAAERNRRPSREAGNAKRVELVACLRNQTRFDAIRRPGERHVDAALLQRVRYCERGQDVTCRSPGCDQTPKLLLRSHVERC